MIDGNTVIGKRIITPFLLQKQILEKLFSNHMGIEKTRLFARKLVYRVNMNTDIASAQKTCAKCLEYQQA